MAKSIAMFDLEVQVLNVLSSLTLLDKLVNEAISKDSLSEEELYEVSSSLDKIVDKSLTTYAALDESYFQVVDAVTSANEVIEDVSKT